MLPRCAFEDPRYINDSHQLECILGSMQQTKWETPNGVCTYKIRVSKHNFTLDFNTIFWVGYDIGRELCFRGKGGKKHI